MVTGYVEPDIEPLAQAWTEVREEFNQGLLPPDLELVRQLEPEPLTGNFRW